MRILNFWGLFEASVLETYYCGAGIQLWFFAFTTLNTSREINGLIIQVVLCG